MIIKIWPEKVDVWVCIGQCFRHCFGVYKLFIYHVFYVWNGCAMWCSFWWSIVKWMNHEISLRTNVKLDEKVQKNSGINFQKHSNRFKKNLEIFGCQRIKKKIEGLWGFEPTTSQPPLQRKWEENKGVVGVRTHNLPNETNWMNKFFKKIRIWIRILIKIEN